MTRARNIAGFSTITTTPSPVHVGPIGVLTATRIDGEFNQVDLATRNITAAGIAATNLQVSGITTGLNVSGIITAQNGINFNGTSTGLNVSGVGTIATLSVTGNATVGGVLTYEDVTRVDSVGVVTARGLSIFGNTTGLQVASGISTFQTATFTGTASQVELIGNEGVSAALRLTADQGDDNGDGWEIRSNQDDNDLTISNNTSGSYVDKLTLKNNGDLHILDKIIHDGDTNTAIRFPAADTFTVETSGSERIRINSSGNFGVATASPAQKFHVYGNSGTTAIALGDNSTTEPYMLLEARETQNTCTVHSRTNNPLTFEINQSEYVRIKQDGHVGIGTDNPVQDLTIYADGPNLRMTHTGNTNQYNSAYVHVDETGMEFNSYQEGTGTRRPIIFTQYTDERMRLDSSGRFLIQTTSARSVGDCTAISQIEGTSFANSSLSLMANAGASAGNQPHLTIGKSRGSADGASDALVSGDGIGLIQWAGADGTDCNSVAAKIHAFVDGTPGSNDMPGRLVFATTADGAATPTEALRLTSDKLVNIAGQGSVFGRLNVPIPTQSGGAAIQVMNTASGSGDGTLTNIALRSVNNAGNNWAHAEYRAHSHKFLHQGTTKVTINTNGLCFNSDTAAANALNDYEEGVFTVTLANSLTVGTQTQLRYTKIGDKVHITGQFRVTSGGSDLIVSNLPFTTLATGSTDEGFSVGIVGLYYVTMPTDGNASGEVLTKTQKNDTNLYFIYNRNNNDPNQHTATTNGYYTVSHWYTTA